MPQAPERVRAAVKWFEEEKGFGFILNPAQGPDVFVHYRQIRGAGFKTLEKGQLVEFELTHNGRSLEALDVMLLPVDGGSNETS